MRLTQKLFTPQPYALFRKAFAGHEFSLLEIGCGNHGASLAKFYLPQCRYFGLDRNARYNNSQEDFALMDKYYEQDLEHNTLDTINHSFDALLLSHVIEHVASGNIFLSNIYKISKPGTRVYIEFPGIRSLNMPSAVDTFAFCDDPTHVRIYTIAELANILLPQGFVIHRAGRLISWSALLKLPFWLCINGMRMLLGKKIISRGLWQICGVTEYVYAEYMPDRQRDSLYFPT